MSECYDLWRRWGRRGGLRLSFEQGGGREIEGELMKDKSYLVKFVYGPSW